MTISEPLTIIFQDQYLVAIDKPTRLLVHRSKIDVHATQFALQRLRDQIGRPVFPVHRLDRPTSGVLLFALSSQIARQVTEQFEARSVRKHYTAMVRGVPQPSGIWDEPLLEKPDRIVDRLATRDKPAQPAITKFETIGSWEVPYSTGKYPNSRYSLVKIQPLTGRRHQIRRHFNHMAHPIIGDTSHGDRRHNRLFFERFNIRRLLLVASALTLNHPVTQQQIILSADLGDEFERAIECLNQACISNLD